LQGGTPKVPVVTEVIFKCSEESLRYYSSSGVNYSRLQHTNTSQYCSRRGNREWGPPTAGEVVTLRVLLVSYYYYYLIVAFILMLVVTHYSPAIPCSPSTTSCSSVVQWYYSYYHRSEDPKYPPRSSKSTGA